MILFYKFIDDEFGEDYISYDVLRCFFTSIKKYSKNGDVDLLDSYYWGYKHSYNSLTDKSVEIITDRGVRIYTRSNDSYSLKDVSESREYADKSLRYMGVNVTGARKGETIVGVRSTASGATMLICEGTVPPQTEFLSKMRLFPDVWSAFVNKLSRIEFFKDMSPDKRILWLNRNERDGDYDMAEIKGVSVTLLNVGDSIFSELDEDRIHTVLTQCIPCMHIRDMFTKDGSLGKRSTLVFFPRYWRISDCIPLKNSYNGICYDVLSKKFVTNIHNKVYVFERLGKDKNVSIGIHIGERKRDIDYIRLLKDIVSTPDEVDTIIKGCKGFTAAGLKSLLQKIIRVSPLYVRVNNVDVNAITSLHTVFTLLLIHPGSFVPDLKLYVTGIESAYKRLAVSIMEDSSIDDPDNLLYLMVCAFISQRLPRGTFKPTVNEYYDLLDICTQAINNKSYYVNDKKFVEYSIDANNTLRSLSFFMNEVRSFQSDLVMVSSIATHHGKRLVRKFTRPEFMLIEHAIDHHWAPEFVHLMNFRTIVNYGAAGSKPYSDIFRRVWINSSSFNPRKDTTKSIDEEFLDGIKKAQRLYYIGLRNDIYRNITLTNETYDKPYRVDMSWIAGMIGSINVSQTMMVTLDPKDLHNLIPMRRPSRSMKKSELTDEERYIAISKATKILRAGVSMNKCSAPVKELENCVLILDDKDYIIRAPDRDIRLGDSLSVNVSVPIVNTEDVSIEDSLMIPNVLGLRLYYEEIMNKLFKKYGIDAVRRFYYYIGTSKLKIRVCGLSREGGGTSFPPSIYDTGATQLLLLCTMLFSYGIRRDEGRINVFIVTSYPILVLIRDITEIYLTTRGREYDSSLYGTIEDTSGRVPYSYQIECLDEMVSRYIDGKRGHFLWLTVGLGKTMIVLSYLQTLQLDAHLPMYVLYTVPKSAIKSIITEIEYFNIRINLLLPIKTWKKHPLVDYVHSHDTLLEYHINIIEHDHLRKVEDDLIKKSADTILIVDEVHKTLRDTKRTSVSLTLSHLSYDFIVLTGTPIIDSNTVRLISWIEQLSEFEVNEKNFYVAASAMVSRKVNTGINEERIDVLAHIPDKVYEYYRELVSPELGGTNPRPKHSDINEAFEVCYNVCTSRMVIETIKYTNNGINVMLVARNYKHQETLYDMLVKKGVNANSILLLQKDTSIFLTDESVSSGKTPDYKIAITTLQRSEGYTLTHMGVMITCVYPSNQATREQLEGRINRLSQHRKTVYYVTVHCGILTYVMQRHKDAASLSAVLKELVKDV